MPEPVCPWPGTCLTMRWRTFPTPTWTPMYEAPKLEKFGTFRELTLVRNPNNTKRVIGDDLIPGIGMDCDGNAPQGDPKACIRS